MPRLAIGCTDGGVFLVDAVVNANPKRLFPGHSRPITALSASSDEKWLVSCAQEPVAIVWSLEVLCKQES